MLRNFDSILVRGTLILLFLAFVPSFAFAQVIINEIAWLVKSAYAADHGLKMGSPVEGGVPLTMGCTFVNLKLYYGKNYRSQTTL